MKLDTFTDRQLGMMRSGLSIIGVSRKDYPEWQSLVRAIDEERAQRFGEAKRRSFAKTKPD